MTADLFAQSGRPRLTAGVDEVGRGPLAGDVVAAAVILNPGAPIAGLADSKALSAKRREQRYEDIVEHSLCWAVGRASVAEIDSLNILHASMLAMQRAVDALSIVPEWVLVDGNRLPRWQYPAEAIVGGDASEPAIAAASIIAKVTRDREMLLLEQDHPGYGFGRHKGYPTKEHLAAIEQRGVLPVHRRSFAPVARLLEAAAS